MVSFVAPLAVSVAMLNVFEYGFATSALYLTFGKNGILIAGQLFVVQGILMIALLLELIGGIIRKNHIFGTEEISGYGTYFISGVIGCLFITCCEIVLALGL